MGVVIFNPRHIPRKRYEADMMQLEIGKFYPIEELISLARAGADRRIVYSIHAHPGAESASLRREGRLPGSGMSSQHPFARVAIVIDGRGR